MNEIQFVQRISEHVPSRAVLETAGISGDEADAFLSTVKIERKSNATTRFTDPLLRLVQLYETSRFEVGMIRLGASVHLIRNWAQVGQVEVDLLVVDFSDGTVRCVSERDPNETLWICAKDGAHFLNALAVAHAHLTKCYWDANYASLFGKARTAMKDCVVGAGGEEFADFFQMLLGLE